MSSSARFFTSDLISGHFHARNQIENRESARGGPFSILGRKKGAEQAWADISYHTIGTKKAHYYQKQIKSPDD